MTVGLAFTIFGYLIYVRKQYHLINGFEADYQAGRKTESYAKKVGVIELILGMILIFLSLLLVICR